MVIARPFSFNHIGSSLLGSYDRAMRKAAIPTQAITTGALWCLGDYMAQKLEKREHLDVKRLAITTVHATCFTGPVGHFWYLGLDSAVAQLFRPQSVAFLATKLALDTFIYGPVLLVAFMTVLTKGMGGSWADVGKKLKKELAPTFAAEMVFWIPFQTVNFTVVPVQYHLLTCNAAALFESVFLCWARSQEDWVGQLQRSWAQRNQQPKLAKLA